MSVLHPSSLAHCNNEDLGVVCGQGYFLMYSV